MRASIASVIRARGPNSAGVVALSGSDRDQGDDGEGRLADPHPVADGEAEAFRHQRVERHARGVQRGLLAGGCCRMGTALSSCGVASGTGGSSSSAPNSG